MVKVLFVCLGNICRSPMAEAVFRDMVEKENLSEKIKIDSAATSSWEHGNPVHHGTREKLAEVGISVEGMYSRPLNDNDLMLTISLEWMIVILIILKDLFVVDKQER